MLQKTDIRREMRTRRAALSAEERARAAAAVCAMLADDDALDAAVAPPRGRGALAVYLASPLEIDLSPYVARMLRHGDLRRSTR